ncbi:hypothetical protein UA08_00229 [Talaromyces atroroseus]|uniref:Uncharacterized protein n=1 Tax=Talaromyces atroroseus TaxID=1441469 RepID=A0A225B9Y1_TALAT|nr:hypothetical protein UA08_00229 [Talaromyces atroroseus]OKL63745.1 hypothetical protein UA08_00229 [Talaromyces atroroseus]
MDAQTQPLSDRSTNTHLQSTTASSTAQDTDKTANTQYSMDYHRKVLQDKIYNGSDHASYVSPSDDIMSPCTKKLSDLKSKRFKKYVFRSLCCCISIRDILTVAAHKCRKTNLAICQTWKEEL